MAKLEILVQAKDNATKTLNEISRATAGLSSTFKKTGFVMLGASTAITAGLLMAVKAAGQEEVGIKRLSVAMGNMGLSYDDAKDSLEKWIDAQQQSTAFADTEQRAALSQLIVLTGNLKKAQDLLTTAMDLARWKNIDLSTAADILTKVYAGNMGTLTRYGIVVREGATATEALAQVQLMASGQAEAYGQTLSGQFNILRNNISDLQEVIGAVLMPIVTSIVGKISEFVNVLKNADPATLNTIVRLGLLGAAFFSAAGSVFLLIGYVPQLIKGFEMLTVTMNLATASAWGFWAALGGMITIAAAASVAISELTGNTAEMNERGVKLWYQNIPEWIMKQLGLTNAVETTTERASELSEELQALGFTGKELTQIYGTLSKAGYLNIGTATIEQVKEYVSRIEALNKAVEETTKTSEEFNITIEGGKVALATAQWALEGITYRTNLYSQAEIELAQAAGKKVKVLETQNDALWKTVESLIEAQKKTDALTESEKRLAGGIPAEGVKKSISEIASQYANIPGFVESQAYINAVTSSMLSDIDAATIFKNYLEQWQKEQALLSFQYGGVMPETGMAYLHKGETVLPAKTTINVPIYLDGDLIGNKIIEIVGNKTRLQGYS